MTLRIPGLCRPSPEPDRPAFTGCGERPRAAVLRRVTYAGAGETRTASAVPVVSGKAVARVPHGTAVEGIVWEWPIQNCRRLCSGCGLLIP